MNNSKLIVITIAATLMVGCASFSKKEFRKDYIKLSEENLSQLNGRYSFYPIRGYGKDNMALTLMHTVHVNSYKDITNERPDSSYYHTTNSISCCVIDLKLLNSRTLKVSLIKNNTVTKDTIYNGKLKNKMFVIDNKELKCHGIPYLFGGCDSEKRRIGLDKNCNLIINRAVSSTGAMLFIIGSGYSYNSAYEYKRIE